MTGLLDPRIHPASDSGRNVARAVVLAGLATAQPKFSIAQEEAAEIAKTFVIGHDKQVELLPALYRMSRVRRRGSVLLENAGPGGNRTSFYRPATEIDSRGPTTDARMKEYARQALPLGIEASQQALLNGEIQSSEITHLITASCTGFDAPGIDIGLMRQLSLQPEVARFHLGFMGCHAAINAMRLAKSLVEADSTAVVLLCCVELCTLHYRYGWHPEQIVANALFADGAAAMVFRERGPQSQRAWQLSSTGSYLIPESEDAMSWRIGDYGFEMGLAPQVPHIIEQRLHGWVSQWLAQRQLTIAQIESWAIHPGGPKIVRAAAQALGLSDVQVDPSLQVLAQHGNMSSATMIFILERLRATNCGCPVVGMAFGPGLMVEACLFE